MPIEIVPELAIEPDMLDDRALALLASLIRIALKSPRLEADAEPAMRNAQLDCPPGELARLVDLLEEHGFVRRVIHLYDGGILVLLTNEGIEALRNTPYAHVLASIPPTFRRQP